MLSKEKKYKCHPKRKEKYKCHRKRTEKKYKCHPKRKEKYKIAIQLSHRLIAISAIQREMRCQQDRSKLNRRTVRNSQWPMQVSNLRPSRY